VGDSVKSPVTVILTSICLGLAALAVPGTPAENGEQELRLLKAAFVFNFAKFTRWSKAAWGNSDEPLKLCTVGDDRLIEALKQLGGRTIQNRKVNILPMGEVETPGKCHMLYVASSERERLSGILATVRDDPVLTVSEIPGFTHTGGIIELFKEQGRIRFYINQTSAEEVGLRLSSRLLSLAVIVKP
jgi:hypothetical protein